MRPSPASLRVRRFRSIAGLVLAAGVAGCGLGDLPEVTEEEIAAVLPGGVAGPTRCPTVDVSRGTQGFPVYAAGRDGDPQFLIYQGAITDAARECTADAQSVTLKIGVSGRLLRGPAGTGTLTARLPVSITVTSIDGETVYSTERLVDATLADGAGSVGFAVVADDVIVLRTPGDSTRDYQVTVGFVRPPTDG